MDNAKKIWWDVRPHPFFSTVEVRICDIPMRADETLAIAALIQATMAKLYKLHSRNQGFRMYSRALIMENKWRAARYGLDGKLIDFGREIEVPATRADARISRLRRRCARRAGQPVGSRIHPAPCSSAATAPTASCAVFEETGDLKKVVEYMVAETQAGL